MGMIEKRANDKDRKDERLVFLARFLIATMDMLITSGDAAMKPQGRRL
jgi:hypothetical protein